MKKIYLAALILALICFYGGTVRAQQADFELLPSRLDLMVKPQSKYTAKFKLTNYGDPGTFTPRLMNAAPDAESGVLTVAKASASPFVFLFSNNKNGTGDPIFLHTNESVSIPVVIEASAGEPKDYYFYFVAESQQPGQAEGNTSVRIQPRLGVPMIVSLTNTGERDAKAAISVFQVGSALSFDLFGRKINLVESGTSVPVFFIVSNIGSNFVSPDAKISLKGPVGGTVEYPVLHRNVYAQSARLMLTKSSYEKYCSNNEVCPRFSMLLQGLLLGPYTMSASLDLGGNAPKSYKSETFLAFPFLPAIAVVLFVMFYIFILHKKVHHKIRRKRHH